MCVRVCVREHARACSVIDMCLFLPSVINIYLSNSKDRICGTKTIIFMNASSEYVKTEKMFCFWCFWKYEKEILPTADFTLQ